MRVQAFLHRHYSSDVGESPVAHAVAVLTGLVLMIVGAALAASLILLPLGVVTGLVGVMLFGAGVWAHIQSPLTLRDLMDTIVTLTSAAVAGTFALAILAAALGLALTAAFEIFQWLVA
jgi:small-conductance mechanosensitive channel